MEVVVAVTVVLLLGFVAVAATVTVVVAGREASGTRSSSQHQRASLVESPDCLQNSSNFQLCRSTFGAVS